MHRPVWIRFLTLLWGVWFTTALTEPAGILACATHGSAAATSHAGAPLSPPASRATQDAHAAHAAHAQHVQQAARGAVAAQGSADLASSASSPSVPSGDAPHGCCTCLGQCCTAAPVTTPAVVEVAIARLVQVDAVAPVVQRAERPARRDHTLPFANGPPIVA
ncbi:MAG: hypothetical protein U0164_15975 [Gemmatimonadaceae bacterium]